MIIAAPSTMVVQGLGCCNMILAISIKLCCIVSVYGSIQNRYKDDATSGHTVGDMYNVIDKVVSNVKYTSKDKHYSSGDEQSIRSSKLILTGADITYNGLSENAGTVSWTTWSPCEVTSPRKKCGIGRSTRYQIQEFSNIQRYHRPCKVPCTNTHKLYFSSSQAVSFYAYTKSSSGVKYTLNNATGVPSTILKGTVRLFVHGWKGSHTSWYCQPMVQELLKNEKDPSSAVFVVDWESLAQDPLFFLACHATASVGSVVAQFIRVLVTRGASRERIHLIGFSLGGKVVSAAGSAISKPKLKRISGIDTPTGCVFFSCGPNLSKNDAQFVDSLHNTLISGYHRQGHAEFYPNGPKTCASQIIHPAHIIARVMKAHERAVHYYIESINNCNYTSKACKSWSQYPSHCMNRFNDMGFHAKQPVITSHQNYFLRAAIKPPYCSYQTKLGKWATRLSEMEKNYIA